LKVGVFRHLKKQFGQIGNMGKINWNEVPEELVNPQMKRKFIYGEKIMIAKMEFADGFVVPWHSHENE